MLERVTGYLVGSVNRWNNGKKAELKDRVSHITGEKMLKGKNI
jgi:ribonucleoside-triphosphate reductase